MQTKGERTRERILRASEKLFSEKGYRNVSMQEICHASGLSKGGLYRHFGSKSELLFALVKKEKRVEQDIREGTSAVDTLENLLKLYRDDMQKCRESLAFALYEYASMENDHILDSGNIEDKELWRRMVAYGVKTGEFNDIDSDIIVDTFLYAYRGVEMWGRVLTFEEKTFENLTEAVRILLIKNYRRR